MQVHIANLECLLELHVTDLVVVLSRRFTVITFHSLAARVLFTSNEFCHILGACETC